MREVVHYVHLLLPGRGMKRKPRSAGATHLRRAHLTCGYNWQSQTTLLDRKELRVMKHPTISVIIPLFNCERYVAEAIDSALRQTYPPLEIVVVNDGSTDSGPAIVESYGDRVRMITQANGGQSSARNTAIAAARGEWVALLDSDDYCCLLYTSPSPRDR